MVVPYGDPSQVHGWKNAFDAGEWGLGRMTQSLTLGCDCLGEIHYFDATLANEQGQPWLDRERDLHARGGLRHPLEARRPAQRHERGAAQPPARDQPHRHGRQLQYGFYWYFYLDGNIQLEVKLTGHRVAHGDRASDPQRRLVMITAPGGSGAGPWSR